MRLRFGNTYKTLVILIAYFCLPSTGAAQAYEIFAKLRELPSPFTVHFAKVLIDYENHECTIIEEYGTQAQYMNRGLAFCSSGELYTLGGLGGQPFYPQILFVFDPDTEEFEYVTDAFDLHYQGGNPGLGAIACVDSFLYAVGSSFFWKMDLGTEEISLLGNVNPSPMPGPELGVLYNEVIYRTSIATGVPGNLQGIYQLDTSNTLNSPRIFPYPQSNWLEYWTRIVGGTPVCNSVFVARQAPGNGDNKGAFYNVKNHSYSLICDLPSYRFIRATSMAEHLPKEECEAIIDLDAVNVSGAGGYDYLHDEVYTCLTEDGFPIAAEKIFIATDETIQEMNIEILSPLPGESLATLGSVAGIDVAGEGTPSLTLLNSGSVASAYFMEMLQLVNYYNSGESLSEGVRQVRVNFTSTSGKQSNDAYGMIEIVELDSVSLEMDDFAAFCEGSSLTISPIVSPSNAQYSWSTGQITREITVSSAGVYSLSVSATGLCPNEGEITVEEWPVVPLLISAPDILCENTLYQIEITADTDYPISFDIYLEHYGVIQQVVNMIGSYSFNHFAEYSAELSLINFQTDAPICIDSSEASVFLNFAPTYEVSLNDTICQGDTLHLNDSTFFFEAGTHYLDLYSVHGCDSQVILNLVVNPTHLLDGLTFTCDPNDQDTTAIYFVNQYGCDSIILSGTAYLPPDSIFIIAYTCFEDSTGFSVDSLTNHHGCDSLVFFQTIYRPPDSTYIQLTTCNPTEAGFFTETMTNAQGCDSLVFTDIQLLPSDSTFLWSGSCDPDDSGTAVQLFTNQHGCDSVVVSVVEYLPPDSSLFYFTSCNPEDEGVFVDSLTNSFGCDSLVITTVVYAEADSTFLTEFTCEEEQAGWSIDSLVNLQGCDSLVFTEIIYLPPDSVVLTEITCDSGQKSPVVEVLSNQFGCDSVVVTFFDFIPPDTTLLFDSSCDPEQAGIFEEVLENRFGCDSVVILEVELLPSHSIMLTEESCNPGDTGTFVQHLVNSFGCDSIVTTIVELLPSHTTLLEFFTCDLAEVDSSSLLLENRFGCDSLVISVTRLAESPELSLNPLVLYEGFGVSCKGEEDGALEAEVEGGMPPYSILWGDGSDLWIRSGLAEGNYSATVTDELGCSGEAAIELLAPDSLRISLVITHPDCFDEQAGGIQVLPVGGVPPYRFSLNSGEFTEENTFVGLQPGLYEIAVLDANMCLRTEAVLIQSPELLEVSLGEDREIAVGDSILLEIITNVPYDSLVSIDWKGLQNPDCEDCPVVWDRPLVSTTYSVTITDRDGCMASDQMTVSVDAARDIFVPNAFSPNGDGINDLFTVYANERTVKQVVSLKVFNRLGEQVFHRTLFPPNEPTEGWDGTYRDQPLNPGVFVWLVEVEFVDGEVLVLSGEVLVVR